MSHSCNDDIRISYQNSLRRRAYWARRVKGAGSARTLDGRTARAQLKYWEGRVLISRGAALGRYRIVVEGREWGDVFGSNGMLR